jgi:hypothetical protein
MTQVETTEITAAEAEAKLVACAKALGLETFGGSTYGLSERISSAVTALKAISFHQHCINRAPKDLAEHEAEYSQARELYRKTRTYSSSFGI